MVDKIYSFVGHEPSERPIFDWINRPQRWEPSINAFVPHVPAGPLDHGNKSDAGTGFPAFETAPLFRASRVIGSRQPFDICGSLRATWLLNRKARERLIAVDVDAFDFVAVGSQLKAGEPGPDLWLCDVVRVIDALDLERSNGVKLDHEHPRRIGLSPYPDGNFFKREAIGSAHFFRLFDFPLGIFCDEEGRTAIHSKPKLSGTTCMQIGIVID